MKKNSRLPMKKIAGFIISSLLFCTANAQLILKGNVHSTSGEALPFINVAMYSATDSTELISGSITDLQGNYILQKVKAGKYQITVSAIGYRTIKETVLLRTPSVGNVIIKDFITDETVTTLNEVVIKANRKNNYADKSVYTFSKEQIKNARYTNDLLSEIGGLSVDMTNNKISKMGGGSVKILINGVNATDNDLKSIPADKVIKIEYYDIPPARYATVSTLVNIITKRMDTGWNGGIDALHAFTTGFGNDNLFLKCVAGNHQISFDYELQYRNYNERLSTDSYKYLLNGENIEYLYQDKDKFGYTNNNINLKYTYSIPENYILQTTISPNFSKNFSDGSSDINKYIDNNLFQGNKYHNQNINSFGPAIDIYFSKKMKQNQELTVDVVGTYYHNKQERLNREMYAESGETTLEDYMNLSNYKKSIIGEAAYTKVWGARTLSIGYKGTWASSNSTISNYLSNGKEYEYESSNNNHYVYTEYGNTLKKIMYRIGIGSTLVDTRNDDTKYTKVLFTPKFIVAYNFNSSQNLQWMLTSSAAIPSISQLSNNSTLITNELLRRGNPYLRSGNNYITTLRYNWNSSWMDLNLTALSTYAKSPISTYYQEEIINGKSYIVSTSENAKSFFQYGISYSLTIRPFKNEVLSIKLYGTATNQKLNSPIIGKYSHWYMPLFYSLSFRKQAWGATYSGNIISKQLDGAYLEQDENRSNLQVFYQHKNLRLIAGCYWLFTKSKYNSETLPNDILHHNSRTSINNNRSMFVLGFSWNFTTGKSLNIKQKIKNRDMDRGTF